MAPGARVGCVAGRHPVKAVEAMGVSDKPTLIRRDEFGRILARYPGQPTRCIDDLLTNEERDALHLWLDEMTRQRRSVLEASAHWVMP